MRCIASILAMLVFVLSPHLQAQPYHFVSIEHLAEQEIGRIVLPQVYRGLGIEISISPLPGKRAQLELTSGRKDGEIMRIWSYGVENPKLIRVPTPYYHLETMAFFKRDEEIHIPGKMALSDFKLVKVRGVKHTNNITHGMPRVTDVSSTEEMFVLLAQGLADVALTNTLDGQLQLKRMRINNITRLSAPLAKLALYHYLAPAHQSLAKKVDKEFRRLIHTGEMQQLIKAAEIKVIQAAAPTSSQ